MHHEVAPVYVYSVCCAVYYACIYGQDACIWICVQEGHGFSGNIASV